MSAALLRAARALRCGGAATRCLATAAQPERQSKTFFEVAAALPRFGEGARLRRVTWRKPEGEPDCFWTVGTVKPRADGRHGKAWGTLTWRGVAGPVREIRGVLKPLWEAVDAPPPPSGPKL